MSSPQSWKEWMKGLYLSIMFAICTHKRCLLKISLHRHRHAPSSETTLISTIVSTTPITATTITMMTIATATTRIKTTSNPTVFVTTQYGGNLISDTPLKLVKLNESLCARSGLSSAIDSWFLFGIVPVCLAVLEFGFWFSFSLCIPKSSQHCMVGCSFAASRPSAFCQPFSVSFSFPN